jgi:16S rRNA (guanine966-N2)-methyltransferase
MKTAPKSAKANRVRIIGGIWRSRLVEFHDQPGIALRPTPDRVRETLFNWLGQTLHGKHCLDLFSGSGALGFEAASRGAASVVMVESNRIAAAQIEKNRDKLGADMCRVVKADVIAFLDSHADVYDVIFVDPPFQSQLLAGVLPLLAARLREGGVAYVESGASIAPEAASLRVLKQGKAGASNFALLARL